MISIVVVNYNTDDLLFHCLQSLESHTDSRGFEVIVVNNGNELKSDMRSRLNLDLRIVNNQENLGYATALNQGIRESSHPILLCLNADTQVAQDSLWHLAAFLESHSEVGVVAPKLVYPDGKLQFSCRRDYTCLGVLGRRFPFGFLPMVEPELRRHLMLDFDHDRILYPDWVQGSCMMIPRNVFDRVGGFDERFFLYFEDYDFCNRTRNRGFKVAYEPSSTVIHHYARSSRNENVHRREFWLHLMSAIKYFRKASTRSPRAFGPDSQFSERLH